MTTAAPSRARVSTQASPIPEAPPVTSAIFPSTWPIRTTSYPRPLTPALSPPPGRLRVAVPEPAAVLGMEGRGEAGPIGACEGGERERQFVGLADIAHVDAHLDPLPGLGHPVGGEQMPRLVEHRVEHRARRLCGQV